MPLETQASEPVEIHGSLTLAQSILSNTYRKGTAVTATVNGPQVGPAKPGLTFAVPTNGANALFPSAQVDLSLPIPILPKKEASPSLSLIPKVSVGLQAFLTGLDKEASSETQAHPFLKAQLAASLALPLSHKTDFLFTPYANGLWYPGIDGVTLKMDDKDLDGQPDFVRPNTELTFGATTGIAFDGTNLTTSWNIDPFDPTLEDGVNSMWGTLNIGRQF